MYLDMVNQIFKKGYKSTDESRKVSRLCFFGMNLRFDMSKGEFPAISVKKLFYKSVVTELLWMLRGDSNVRWLNDNGCTIWNKDAYNKYVSVMAPYYSKISSNWTKPPIMTQDQFNEAIKSGKSIVFSNGYKLGDLGPVYGNQWNKNGQLKNMVEALISGVERNDIMVSAWNMAELDSMALKPCHFNIQLNIRYDSEKRRILDLLWSQRSADVGLGVPFNIASYATLLTLLCQVFNYVPGELIGHFGNAHIYENQYEPLSKMLDSSEVKSNPKMFINSQAVNEIKESGDVSFSSFTNLIKKIKPENFSLVDYTPGGIYKMDMLSKII
jgi:thymidylate synthase